jgi:hypothetical protein
MTKNTKGMKTTLEHFRIPATYCGCEEGWEREFDPVVMKLVSQVVQRQCYHGKNKRGQNITEFTVEELSEVIADVVLRVLLYAGWRGMFNPNPVHDVFQAIRTPEPSGDVVTGEPVGTLPKDSEYRCVCRPGC